MQSEWQKQGWLRKIFEVRKQMKSRKAKTEIAARMIDER
jgi:hypothetical protein